MDVVRSVAKELITVALKSVARTNVFNRRRTTSIVSRRKNYFKRKLPNALKVEAA